MQIDLHSISSLVVTSFVEVNGDDCFLCGHWSALNTTHLHLHYILHITYVIKLIHLLLTSHTLGYFDYLVGGNV